MSTERVQLLFLQSVPLLLPHWKNLLSSCYVTRAQSLVDSCEVFLKNENLQKESWGSALTLVMERRLNLYLIDLRIHYRAVEPLRYFCRALSLLSIPALCILLWQRRCPWGAVGQGKNPGCSMAVVAKMRTEMLMPVCYHIDWTAKGKIDI